MSKVGIAGLTSGVLAMLMLLLLATSCTIVEPGYVGIKVHMTGSERGVDDIPMVTGRVFYNPITHDIFEFPTFIQTAIWTRDTREASSNDESITFNSAEGSVLNADVSVAYAFNDQLVPELFVEFRKTAQEITDTYMRMRIRDAFNRYGGQMNAVQIFGERKQELLDSVTTYITYELGPKGFVVDQIGFIGAPRADNQVMASINAVIQAKQNAIEAENRVRQAEAEAQQKIATADGDAQSQLIRARAEAEANGIIARSLSATLVQWESIRKWNGQMPQVTGGATPFVTLPQR
jgi:regulator of protease activity HflC (stomatin/prohibitin superfamily)